MGYNPSPPAVSKRPITKPPSPQGSNKMSNPMSGDRKLGPLKVTTKREGTTYDLEEVFDIILRLENGDPSKTLTRLIQMFEPTDSGIRKKTKVLATILTRKYPDKYDYEPDEDEDPERELYEYKAEVKRNQIKQVLTFGLIAMILMTFISVGLIFLLSKLETDEKPKPIAPIEQTLNKGESREL